MPESLHIVHHLDQIEDNTVKRIIESCVDTGLTLTSDGRTDVCEKYWTTQHDVREDQVLND